MVRLKRAHQAQRALTLLAAVAAALPVIASTVRGLAEHWMPAGDQAIIAIRSYDVLGSHTPLVGQYSYAGLVTGQLTHSLGPMLYWLLALPARFGPAGAQPLTMGIVNAACVVGVLLLARRRGGTTLMLATALAIALMCRSLGTETFHDTWNPSAGVFPFTLLIFVCWSLACGEYRLLPLAVLLASFVAQCQLAYLPPAVGMLAIGAGGLFAARPKAWRRWALVALGVAVVCWAAPVYDQIVGSGNFSRVVRSATTSTSTLGSSVGWHAAVRAVGLPPWWLVRPHTSFDRQHDVRGAQGTLRTATAVALLLALLTALLVGLRRRRADVAAGAAIALVLVGALAAVAADTPTVPRLAATLGYTLWWASPAGMWVWLLIAFAAVALGPGALRHVRAPALTWVLALGALTAGAAVSAAAGPDQHAGEYAALGTLTRSLNRSVPRDKTVLIAGTLAPSTIIARPTITWALRRHGDRVLGSGELQRLGDYYEYRGQRYDYILYAYDSPRAAVPPGARSVIRLPWSGHTIVVSLAPAAPTRH